MSLLLRQDQELGLSQAVAAVMGDPRRSAGCMHDAASLLRQRLYALALGYEDLNDHEGLRQDLAIQTAVCSAKAPPRTTGFGVVSSLRYAGDPSLDQGKMSLSRVFLTLRGGGQPVPGKLLTGVLEFDLVEQARDLASHLGSPLEGR